MSRLTVSRQTRESPVLRRVTVKRQVRPGHTSGRVIPRGISPTPGIAPSVSSSLSPRQHVSGARHFGADLARYAGGEQQQEEPQRATPNTPPPSTTPPRGASPARAPSTEPMHTEEEEQVNPGAGGFVPAPNLGGDGATSSQPGTGELFAFCPCSFFFSV